MLGLSPEETVLALLVAVFGAARLSRIAFHDDYPPAEWVRAHWIALVGDRWGKLVECIWCGTPYITAICMAWGYWSDFHWSWWAFFGWLALSQGASTLLAYDEPPA